MDFLKQCEKFKTFCTLKHITTTGQYSGTDANAFILCKGMIEYNYQSEDLSLNAIKKQIIDDKLNGVWTSGLTDYMKMLTESYYKESWSKRHDMLIDIVKMKTLATFCGRFNNYKVSLTKDTYTIKISDDCSVFFTLMDDGSIKMDKMTKGNDIQDRNYIFDNVKEFINFLHNIEEHLETDDKVLKMVLI